MLGQNSSILINKKPINLAKPILIKYSSIWPDLSDLLPNKSKHFFSHWAGFAPAEPLNTSAQRLT